jgi:hypothetical protein
MDLLRGVVFVGVRRTEGRLRVLPLQPIYRWVNDLRSTVHVGRIKTRCHDVVNTLPQSGNH